MKYHSVSEQNPERKIALRIVPVSRETEERLEIYETLLKKWQTIKNLVAPSTMKLLWTRHFADSAQVLDILPNAKIWADLGSGGGFPGMIIAIRLADVAGAKVHLIESDNRKCAFLREVARATGACAEVHHGRIEDVLDKLGSLDAVSARALMPLPKLLALCENAIKSGATGIFLKGQDMASELTDAPIFSRLIISSRPSATDSKGRIVVVKAGRDNGEAR